MAKRKKARKTAATSPLVRWGFQVLEHGLSHYLRSDSPTDMKFALLHIDQAVELLLKERVRQGGKSINKPGNPKETISIWQAYEILEKELHLKIPERTDLEMLHDERNNIQHKYGNPSPEDADFHVGNAMKFIDRFVRDELKLTLADYIPSDFLTRVL
jgi:hypothetical protein